jgi:hypothetical protein
MKPITITWATTASSVSLVSSAATATVDVPLLFAKPIYVSTKTTTQPVVAYTLPNGIVRNIVIAAVTGSVAGVSFAVVGLDQNGNQLSETIVGTAAGALHYKTILSVTPTTAITATVNVGLGNVGSTLLSPMDVYNKNNNFTLAYKVSGTVSLSPYYTVNQVVDFVDGVQTIISTFVQDPTLYYVLPTTNPNLIDSPSTSTAVPVTTTSAYSFVGIPLTGLLTSVGATSGSFTQTIIQQGAAY